MIQYIPSPSPSSTIPICLLIYYSALKLLCFGKDFIQLFGDTSHPNHKLPSEYNIQSFQHQAALNEIQAYLGEVAYCTFTKADLTFGLQRLLFKYKYLQNTSYEKSINQPVFEECVGCNVQLSKEEVDQLWMV